MTTAAVPSMTFQEEMSWLKKEIKRRGYYRKQPIRMLFNRFLLLGLQLVGVVGYWTNDQWLIKAVSVFLLTAGVIGIATYTHTASHQSLFKTRWSNALMVFFGYPFQIGLSATHWWYKHLVVHHPNPNIYGLDDDMDMKPYFAITQQEINEASRAGRVWYKWQWVFFPFAVSLNFLNMQLNGWKYLLGCLADRTQRKPKHWLDLGSLVLHYGVFVGLPTLFFPFSEVITFYLICLLMSGYGAYIVLAPGHLPIEASVFTATALANDPYLRQLATTVNFRAGWLGSWFCCGLDYQIEHHLFPGVSHQFYPSISALLQPICQRHGYPYQTLGWGESLWKAYQILIWPKPVYDTVPAV